MGVGDWLKRKPVARVADERGRELRIERVDCITDPKRVR